MGLQRVGHDLATKQQPANFVLANSLWTLQPGHVPTPSQGKPGTLKYPGADWGLGPPLCTCAGPREPPAFESLEDHVKNGDSWTEGDRLSQFAQNDPSFSTGSPMSSAQEVPCPGLSTSAYLGPTPDPRRTTAEDSGRGI